MVANKNWLTNRFIKLIPDSVSLALVLALTRNTNSPPVKTTLFCCILLSPAGGSDIV